MTDYNVTVGKELLPELLSNQNSLANLVEDILHQILEAQVTESSGTEKHERSDEWVFKLTIQKATPHGKRLLGGLKYVV